MFVSSERKYKDMEGYASIFRNQISVF